MSRANPRFRRNNPHLPPVGTGFGVVVYKILGIVAGQETVSTFSYQAAVPTPTGTQMTTLLNAISANVLASFVACLSVDWTVVREDLDLVQRNDINGVFTGAHTGTVGSRGTPTLSTTMAIVLDRTSLVKGQHGRGRLSLPAVCAADCTASSITSATLKTALGTLETAMKATASDGANTWTPCVAERSPQSPRLVIGSSAIQTVTFNTVLGTIRRRKLGIGI